VGSDRYQHAQNLPQPWVYADIGYN
jgi:hypothetical protein